MLSVQTRCRVKKHQRDMKFPFCGTAVSLVGLAHLPAHKLLQTLVTPSNTFSYMPPGEQSLGQITPLCSALIGVKSGGCKHVWLKSTGLVDWEHIYYLIIEPWNEPLIKAKQPWKVYKIFAKLFLKEKVGSR